MSEKLEREALGGRAHWDKKDRFSKSRRWSGQEYSGGYKEENQLPPLGQHNSSVFLHKIP